MNIDFITIPLGVLTILAFLMAFAIAYFAIPLIVYADNKNGLYSMPNGRTSHNKPTPVFGGIAVFTGFIIATITFGGSHFDSKSIYCIAGLIIIFIVGAKDDLTCCKPRKKLLGQILVTFYTSVLADIRISNLHGFLNIGEIPYLVSILITMFIILVIINSFNLIDGIDGLAAGIGILISSILGLWFLLTANFLYSIMSFAMTGSLIAFFYFNVFSKQNKIFLGDTGSEIIGLILGLLVVRFLQLEPYVKGLAVITSTTAFAISLFIVPLFDMLRVFTLRIVQGKSPFHADRQHIHHRLLELGFNHLQSTIILVSTSLVFIILTYLGNDLGTHFLILTQFGTCILLSEILVVQVKGRVLKNQNSQ